MGKGGDGREGDRGEGKGTVEKEIEGKGEGRR